jgi:hypothetical protein
LTAISLPRSPLVAALTTELFSPAVEVVMVQESDYELARSLLLRPRMFFSEAQTLRDVLALLHGAAVGRYPPHGSGFLPGFDDFVRHRFNVPAGAGYVTLLREFGHRPIFDACEAVLVLLEEWRASEGYQQRRDPVA